jgi:hypothetical protein
MRFLNVVPSGRTCTCATHFESTVHFVHCVGPGHACGRVAPCEPCWRQRFQDVLSRAFKPWQHFFQC